MKIIPAFILDPAPGIRWRRLLPAALALLLLIPDPAVAQGNASLAVNSSYLFHLATFTGTVPFEWVPMAVDEALGEVYVCHGAERSVRVFNESGLEVYRFGDNDRLGSMNDIALLANGDLLLLSYPQHGSDPVLLRCDFRGEVREEIVFTGLPPVLERFRPERMVLHQGRLYLADMNAMQVAVFDPQGRFREHFDLAGLLGLTSEGAVNAGLAGFDVDPEGALLFTVPVRFHAYRLQPGRGLEEFGQAGGAPGRFNVVGGIAAGPNGLIFITDTLKSVVIVFDRNFNFISEFGHRGGHPESLVAPKNLAVSRGGMLYVTQLARQGIKVFRLTVTSLEQHEDSKG